MFRTLLALFVALAIIAEASAQTTPATATKTTVRTKAAVRRPAAKTKRTTTKTKVAANTVAQPAYGTRTDIGPGGNGAVGSTESADGKGQGVYAAPGMPVNIDNPKKVEGYNGPAPAKPRSGTTLTPR